MKHNQGFTLIELLISVALGLIISMLVMQLLISSNRTAALSDGILQAQETGRFAISYLSSSIQKAGFNQNGTSPKAYMSGTDCSTVNPLPTYCINNSDTNGGDRIAIVRAASAIDNLTCNGTALGVTSGTPIIDVFWVANNNLNCASYNYASKAAIGSTQAIVNNVEALHALYGIEDTAIATGANNVTRYLRSSDVGDNNWAKVKAVKLSLLTRGNENDTLDNQRRVYVLLDANPYAFTDRIARQIFTTSVLRLN